MLPTHYKLILICSLLVLNSGCIRFSEYKSGHYKRTQSNSRGVTQHRVKSGETLYSIAFQYGLDPRDIASWNKIRKPYTIYPKQKLRILPGATENSKNKQVTKAKAATSWSSKSKPQYAHKLQWSWPTKGEVVSTFLLSDPGRRGIEIKGRKGQPILAAAAGRVVYSGNSLRGYGNLIILKHNDTYFSAYAHTEDVVVKEQEKVKVGQRLADMGNTSSEKTELHFEIRRDGKPVNPLGYLPKQR